MLSARLNGIRPDICRLYNDGVKPGELSPDGKPSGIFVKLVLTADKPFKRKACGLLSHNAIYFGEPNCDCPEADIYNLTFCKKTHYRTRGSRSRPCAIARIFHRGKHWDVPSPRSGASHATAARK